MQVEEHVPLAPLTTFGIGGPARFFVRVTDLAGLAEALTYAREHHLEVLLLGGGSNVLIDDAGFGGLVIKIEIKGIGTQESASPSDLLAHALEPELGSLAKGSSGGEVMIYVGAGESWDALVARAVEEELWGIENLSGIPGTVGGAVQGNIGAYGQAVSQTLIWVEAYDVYTATVQRFENAACQFGYRDSVFKQMDGRYVILRAAFALSRAQNAQLAYKDLAERFSGNPHPSLEDIREAVIVIRRAKFPDLSKEGTAGSFFKNPIVPQVEAERLAEVYRGLPLFPVPEVPGHTKIAVAWLMDHTLKLHGTSVGGARLFEKQILVIAAQRGGSAHDVRALAARVQEKVRETCGIELEPEVRIIIA